MKKILLLFTVLLSAIAVNAQDGQTPALYVRGGDPGWGAQSDDTWKETSVSGTVHTWDWTTSPKTLTAGFKLAAITEVNAGWDDSANYGPSTNTEVDLSNGTFTCTLASGPASANLIPAGSNISVAKIVLDTADGSLTITGSNGAALDPTTVPMYLRGDSFAKGWAADDKYKATYVQASNSYVWNFSPAITITGGFKLGDASQDFNVHNYGYDTNEEASSTVEIGVAKKVMKGGANNNFEVATDEELTGVTRVTFDATAMTLLIQTGTTAVEETAAASVYAANGRVYAEGEVVIYDMVGKNVTSQNGSLKGIYIVDVDGVKTTINVK